MFKAKQIYLARLLAIMVAFCFVSFINVQIISAQTAIEPPKGLAWGMSYEDVKIQLETEPDKDKRMKIEKLKEEKKLFPSFLTAKIKDAEFFDKKTQTAYAIFSMDKKLLSMYFTFEWTNDEESGLTRKGGTGRRNCWEFHQKLVGGLTAKYGEPTKNDVNDEDVGKIITNKSWFETTVGDEAGNEISVGLTRNVSKVLGAELDKYYVHFVYQSKEYVKAKKAKLADEI